MNIRYFIFFLLLAVFITTLSSIPSLGSGLLHSSILNQVVRKSIHIILFAILAILSWQSCPGLDKDISVKIMVGKRGTEGDPQITQITRIRKKGTEDG